MSVKVLVLCFLLAHVAVASAEDPPKVTHEAAKPAVNPLNSGIGAAKDAAEKAAKTGQDLAGNAKKGLDGIMKGKGAKEVTEAVVALPKAALQTVVLGVKGIGDIMEDITKGFGSIFSGF